MSNFGIYSGKEFLEKNLKKREWLIENIMRESDSVILVGNEKSGKSLLIQQLICSLTTQHPFIDRWAVLKPCRVSYVQLEGELGDTQDRYKRMIKYIEFDPKNFQILFLPPLELQNRSGILSLQKELQPHKPDVVIIDPIYFAFTGSLSDDGLVRKFIGHIRILKDSLNCAVMLIHHTHKVRWSNQGSMIMEGDEAIFGSKFLKAYPDHTLLFIYDKKNNVRILSCETQRSGDIIKRATLKLIEPDPLYYEETEQNPPKSEVVYDLLKNPSYSEGLTVEQITKELSFSRNLFYKAIKLLIKEGKVIKTDDRRPVIYKIISVLFCVLSSIYSILH